MPKKVSRWQCEFCMRVSRSRGSITKHEKHCYGNADRIVRTGELALWRTIPRELTQENSYGVPMSDWTETIDGPVKHPWWPVDNDGEIQLGMFYDGDKWVDIPGYCWPYFSPGACWRDEHIPGYMAKYSTKGMCRNLDLVKKFIDELKDTEVGFCEKCKEDFSWELHSWSDISDMIGADEYYFKRICVNPKCDQREDNTDD